MGSVNGGNNKLDLSSFANGTIVGQSDSDSNLFFRYSPCRNAFKCATTADMIDLYDITSETCDRTLAIWNGDGDVNYNEKEKSWEFVYTDGESCDGFASITTVLWTCNTDIASFKVTKAYTSAPCQNFIEIEANI